MPTLRALDDRVAPDSDEDVAEARDEPDLLLIDRGRRPKLNNVSPQRFCWLGRDRSGRDGRVEFLIAANGLTAHE